MLACTLFITALNYTLKSVLVLLPAGISFYLFGFLFTILGLLYFHMKFKILLSIFVKKFVEILMQIALTL